ncbi:MAG TPA: cupin domain-containing protein [Gaiellaceae bacterium]|nr:cupin domain-containing protein [Gaiellaceae bacterium]
MAILPNPPFEPLDERDPDDYRPTSVWSGPLVDPVSPHGYVRDLSVILETIAPGDRIPLHRHQIDEAIVVESGEVEVTLGDQILLVTGRSVAFFPAGVEHGARNVGSGDAHYTAFFPSAAIDIEYLERNPAPGTEGDAPQPPVVYDARAG